MNPPVGHDKWHKVSSMKKIDVSFFTAFRTTGGVDSAIDGIEHGLIRELNSVIGDMKGEEVAFTVSVSRTPWYAYQFTATAMVEQCLPWRVLDLCEYERELAKEQYEATRLHWDKLLGFDTEEAIRQW